MHDGRQKSSIFIWHVICFFDSFSGARRCANQACRGLLKAVEQEPFLNTCRRKILRNAISFFQVDLMALTLRQLKYFVATAELGQISQAAIQLTISQSAVTNAIKELEDSLGTRLFMRTASGMTLTNTGRRFLN
jgi:hypothetical protein